jgi:REP element-mobilizing transposase RayT
MARKWTNKNTPGALHFVTANLSDRAQVFLDDSYCLLFLAAVQQLRESWPFKLIAYVRCPITAT